MYLRNLGSLDGVREERLCSNVRDNNMKLLPLTVLTSVLFVVTPAYALDFWHSGTTWAGQGQCSSEFTFDSGGEEINKLRVEVTVVNRSGKKVVSGILEIGQLGASSADRYARTFLEGEEFCEDDLTIVVNKATAVIDGKRVDLLKTKSLATRDFKPFTLRVGR